MADLRDAPHDTDSVNAVVDLDAPSQPPAEEATATAATPVPSAERADALLASHPVIDGHNSLAPTLLRRRAAGHSHDLEQGENFLDTDMPRIRAGALGAQFWSLQVAGDADDDVRAVSTTLELIDLVRDLIASCPDSLRLALGAGDLADARHCGRVASFLGPVSGRAIGDSLATLRAFHFLGVRALAPAGARWADKGLTRFGQEAVREMNRLGVVIDLSGASDETARATLAVTKAPVMFSHSAAGALTPDPGNVPDEILALLGANSGVCMVSFDPALTSRDGRAPAVSAVADHVERVRDVAGPECVGLSGTYGREAETPRTAGLEDTSCYPRLITELLDRGWDDTAITALTWGNAARVLRDTEFLARAAQGRRAASTATIEELDDARR
ncbi:dipeptidase [Streptomyces sp. IB2014 016-6]|uniref:dipeptidase n=1 Tax=Streptomyces sp. IB2014 016-6 TaxID=2517818 RepID=UPI0011C9FC7D|nr:dipeptidase [Streptomyces sp. IB2014 016-6]TXL84044.1 membrane dipeptidase [Streptomyces sp. IB2014 016-6]